MIKSIDFGFIVSRVLNFYQLGGMQAVLDLPVRTFWMLHRNIDRILAERDMRMAEVAIRSQSQDGVEGLFEDLQKQLGRVVVIEIDPQEHVRRAMSERDTAGLMALKALE